MIDGPQERLAVLSFALLVAIGVMSGLLSAWQVFSVSVVVLLGSIAALVLHQAQRSGRRAAGQSELRRCILDLSQQIERSDAVITEALAKIVQDGTVDLQRELKVMRRLEGERHARTRKALEVHESILSSPNPQLLENLDLKERRLLGVVEAERVRMQDRHQELLELYASGHPEREER